MVTSALPAVHLVWIGKELPVLPRLTLSSFIKCGHPVILHSYNDFENLPLGVTREDANKIIPEKDITHLQGKGSLAFVADIFRYRLLKNGAEIYSDCDVFCVKPFPRTDYLLGYESGDVICNAVLALPPHSKLLNTLVEKTSDPFFIPPWYSEKRQNRYRIRKALGFPKQTNSMTWGIFGPEMVSWYAKETEEDQHALPYDYLYPVHYQCIRQFFDPGLNIDDIITHRTLCIHLYGEMFRRLNVNLSNICPDSPFGQMLKITNTFV